MLQVQLVPRIFFSEQQALSEDHIYVVILRITRASCGLHICSSYVERFQTIQWYSDVFTCIKIKALLLQWVCSVGVPA